ncbi:nuclease-related domain-containing DEAD/DEAH box helicase [uncultured Schumannella sp.]|uniref:nuclease-related domain-containing DEAD/DEAH box helicase n=1 Tax=uncultured Schumannella sp. TaxID=1195956 RepID=UPI0025E90FF5|nr:UvrD-helicase domain-containing protein [uncultured Schumannella sp.]
MGAGDSARLEAERQLLMRDQHAEAARNAEADAARWMAAYRTEKRTAEALAPLTAHGYHLLADRGWPGSRRAQVDLIVIGPSGVFIVDTKAWAEVTVAAGRVFRDQADVTDEFDKLVSLTLDTEAALAEIGLAPGEVHAVVAFAGKKNIRGEVGAVELIGDVDVARHILKPGQRLTANQVNSVLRVLAEFFPVVGAPAPVNVTLPEPVAPIPSLTLDIPDLPSADEVQALHLESMLAPPIEEWMAFLHPDQARLVRRSFGGPARIRGAAGTGKTVVGLHRAAYLARTRPGKILVTTYVRTLPAVLKNLMTRLAPEVADRVEFVGAHKFALDLLKERGVAVKVDGRKASEAFSTAWRTSGGDLRRLETNPQYWQEEIESVIKGRGFTVFEQYADCARIGRKRRLTVDQRREMWELYSEYEAELRRRRIHDFADVILLAERELQREPLEGYSAVIVDEAQDLSCAMVRMMWSVAGDGPDAFTLIGDGQQTVYPGGYSLAEVGISLAGRGVVLDVNYRNTAEILEAAGRIVADDQYTDIEDAATIGFEGGGAPSRHGARPVFVRFDSPREHSEAMVARIRTITQSIDTSLGDIGVLCSTNGQAQSVQSLLEAQGITSVNLLDYDGTQADAVKVGTIKRAKGLEFKHVLLPWTRADLVSPATVRALDGAESLLEREERERRELYVAMTRARDGLWVGTVR